MGGIPSTGYSPPTSSDGDYLASLQGFTHCCHVAGGDHSVLVEKKQVLARGNSSANIASKRLTCRAESSTITRSKLPA